MSMTVGDSACDVLRQARALADSGDRLGAIAAGAAGLRRIASSDAQAAADLEKALVSWRFEAFGELDRSRAGAPIWPPQTPDPAPDRVGIVEIDQGSLNAEILGGAIGHHGSLCVRGLLSRDEAESLRAGIDTTFDARDAFYAGTATPGQSAWYSPFDWGEFSPRGHSRAWGEQMGGIWTVDSPHMMNRLIGIFETSGLVDVIAQYLGERPALSIGKSTLRRATQKPTTDAGHGWHQDGAFLGAVRSVNVWIALSDCGVDAPGLDVVGRRLPYVMQTGSHGAGLYWTVGNGVVDMLADGGAPIQSPIFAPGDALLFDHLMLHRTGAPPVATKPRWAIESWFFAPSAYPMDQGPFVI